MHAHAQTHHHSELQRGKLRGGEPYPRRHVAAAHGSHHSSRSNRGQHHPPEPHNPHCSHQAKSVRRLSIWYSWRFSSDTTGLLSPRCASPDACGQLLLEPSGTVDLRDVKGRCTVSIGRPLDEVIYVKVESGSLNCRLQSTFDKTLLNLTDTVVRCPLSVGDYSRVFVFPQRSTWRFLTGWCL